MKEHDSYKEILKELEQTFVQQTDKVLLVDNSPFEKSKKTPSCIV